MNVLIYIDSEEQRAQLLDNRRALLRRFYEDLLIEIQKETRWLDLQVSELFYVTFQYPTSLFPTEIEQGIEEIKTKAKDVLNSSYMNYKRCLTLG